MGDPLVIVMGYGCDPNGKRMKEYLDYAAQVVSRLGYARVIVTGGFTNPRQFPGVSEAAMMKKELAKRGIVAEDIILEEDALDTNQNIGFCQLIIADFLKKPSMIYVVCDSIRKLKICVIVQKYFTARVLGFDFKRSIWEKIRQIPATIKDIVALYFPLVEDIAIWLRKRAWGIKEKGGTEKLI